VNLQDMGIVLSHTDYPADIMYDFIGFAQPLPVMGAAWGLQVIYLGAGDMDETTPLRPFGTGRTFTASDIAVGGTYSMRMTNRFSVGGTVKYLQENLADEVARGWSVDVGTFYDTGWKSLRIAMLVSNFGPDMTFVSSPFPMPMSFKFGMAGDLISSETNRLTLSIEGVHPNDNREELHFGLEYAYNDFAFLRVGRKVNGWARADYADWQEDPEGNNPYLEYPVIDEDGGPTIDGLALGGGVRIPGIGLSVDYAWTTIPYFGSLHRFSLVYGGGGK
jgi:hypothetical protein